MADRKVLPISNVISRPKFSFPFSRISAARFIICARCANDVLRYSRKVCAASWSLLSTTSSECCSNSRSSSPVAGLMLARVLEFLTKFWVLMRRPLSLRIQNIAKAAPTRVSPRKALNDFHELVRDYREQDRSIAWTAVYEKSRRSKAPFGPECSMQNEGVPFKAFGHGTPVPKSSIQKQPCKPRGASYLLTHFDHSSSCRISNSQEVPHGNPLIRG